MHANGAQDLIIKNTIAKILDFDHPPLKICMYTVSCSFCFQVYGIYQCLHVNLITTSIDVYHLKKPGTVYVVPMHQVIIKSYKHLYQLKLQFT